MLARYVICVAALLGLSACDTGSPAEPGPSAPVAVTAQAVTGMSPGEFRFGLTENGHTTTNPIYRPGTTESLIESEYNPAYAASLWLAGTQAGDTRVNIGTFNGYSTTYAPCSDGSGGAFALSADSTYLADGWPASVGAPTQPDGSPRVYGDEMLWTSVCSSPSEAFDLADRPVTGLRVNLAVFRYNADPLTTYIRYELINEGTEALTDAYLGQWADPDWIWPSDNLSGYDASRNLSYVYLSEETGRTGAQPYTASERGRVTGYTILETPGIAALAGHRRLDKNILGPTNGELTTSRGYSYDAYLSALMGLGNDGSVLTDASGAPIRFAFSGDPVSRTGDVDGSDRDEDGMLEGRELRTLLSAGPFSLAPGQAEVFTVAWSVAVGDDLASGIAALKARIDESRSAMARWRFPTER